MQSFLLQLLCFSCDKCTNCNQWSKTALLKFCPGGLEMIGQYVFTVHFLIWPITRCLLYHSHNHNFIRQTHPLLIKVYGLIAWCNNISCLSAGIPGDSIDLVTVLCTKCIYMDWILQKSKKVLKTKQKFSHRRCREKNDSTWIRNRNIMQWRKWSKQVNESVSG